MFNAEPRSATHMRADGRRPLPDGWRWARLGDVCEFKYGAGLPAHARAEGTVPVFGSNGVVGYHNVSLTTDPTIVIGRKGSIGEVQFSEVGCWPIDTTYYVDETHVAIDFIWLTYALRALPLRQLNKAAAVPGLNRDDAYRLLIPLPPLAEQRRITAILAVRMATVERARAVAQAQLEAATKLTHSFLRQSLACSDLQTVRVCDCTTEVTTGVGEHWADYRLVGATRAGIAPAKEGVGRHPERYKLVGEGAIFYNPMRILLGSIAMITYGEEPGITSPDYVVFRSLVGRLHPVWFYHWLRSPSGETFIKTLARGAVRERMLYRRLASAEIQIPPWEVQVEVAEKLRTTSRLQAIITAQLDAINSLPDALLRQAFTGQLTVEMQQKRGEDRIRRQMQRKLKGPQSAKRRAIWVLHYQPRLRMQQRRWSRSPNIIENARTRFHRRRLWR